MAQRLCSFLVVFLLIFIRNSPAQENPGRSFHSEDAKKLKELDFGKKIQPKWFELQPAIYLQRDAGSSLIFPNNDKVNFLQEHASRRQSLSLYLLPSYYISSLGIVCRNEWQLEKMTSIPFRVRLGSLEYVNYLERKPNALRPVR